MSDDCSHKCGSCDKNCSSKENMLFEQNEKSNVKKVIAVVSGKGGVGKSLITSMIAVYSMKKGYSTAIMDADITGPSIPKMFGIGKGGESDDGSIHPSVSNGGIAVMSLNLLVENETDPVIWRGPVIGGAVRQFWTDVAWGDRDYMFIDMPPGTGDVPLTVFQSIPVDGIIVVTSPQELVGVIVEKAVNMAKMMNIPILGMVENMSYAVCPDCGRKIEVFGKSRIKETAERLGIKNYISLPFDTAVPLLCDKGMMENYDVTSAADFFAECLKDL